MGLRNAVRMAKWLVLAVVAVPVLTFAYSGSVSAADTEKPRIGFLLKTMQEDRYQTDKTLFIARAESLGADVLFDSDSVVQIEVHLPEEYWRALCGQSRSFQSAIENPLAKPYTYFRGDIRINGVVIEDVGIRKKGFIGSQDEVRPALKIKFDEYVDQRPIDGIDRLTLNNNKQDRALVSQFLTYKLFRKAGLAAPRCRSPSAGRFRSAPPTARRSPGSP